jgi:hypothetical protein
MGERALLSWAELDTLSCSLNEAPDRMECASAADSSAAAAAHQEWHASAFTWDAEELVRRMRACAAGALLA